MNRIYVKIAVEIITNFVFGVINFHTTGNFYCIIFFIFSDMKSTFGLALFDFSYCKFRIYIAV